MYQKSQYIIRGQTINFASTTWSTVSETKTRNKLTTLPKDASECQMTLHAQPTKCSFQPHAQASYRCTKLGKALPKSSLHKNTIIAIFLKTDVQITRPRSENMPRYSLLIK